MITPSYGVSATERMLPVLDLDFSTASLDSRVSVSRALNTATVTNSDGSVTIVNANLPRFDYRNGRYWLLVEPTRTNLYTNSILDGAVTGTPGTPPTGWTNGATTGTISAIAASNYAAGFKLTISCSATRRSMYQYPIAVAANTSYTLSAAIELVSGTGANTAIFQFINVTLLPTGSTITGYTIDGVAKTSTDQISIGTHIISMTVATSSTAGNAAFAIGNGLQSNNTAVIKFYNVQVEVGSSYTSYIPTTTTTLARNADVVTMTGTNFSNWWHATSGSMVVYAQQSNVGGTSPWVQFDDTTASNIITLRGNTTNPELYIKATTDQAQIDAGTIAAYTAYNLSGAWNTNDCAAAISAGAPVTDTSATIPTVTQARLGSDGTNYLNGWLGSIQYWPLRLTDSQVQALSK